MGSEYEEISEEHILFKDETVVVAVKDSVFTPGQVTVFPTQKFTILEQVPEDILVKCVAVANKVSIAAFEAMGAQGTNILIQNGLAAGQTVSHFGIEIIPRQAEDSLELKWEGKPVEDDELERVAEMIKDVLDGKNEEKVIEEKKEGKEDEGENYLLKSLKKIP